MATDSTLTQGAFRASRYYGGKRDAAMNQVGDTLNKGIGKLRDNYDAEIAEEAKLKSDKADEAAQKVLDTEGQDTPESDAFYREHLEQKKEEYLKAKEEGLPTESIIQNINTETGLKASFKEDRIRLASNWAGKSSENNQSAGGFGMALERDPDTKAFLEANIDPEYTKQINDKGEEEIGIVGPDGKFMSRKAFGDLQASMEVDNKSFNRIEEVTSVYKKMGDDSSSSDFFDREEASKGIRMIVNDGNIQSLMHDPNFGGTSFVDDLKSGGIFKGLKYADLGIKAKGGDDTISEDDELTEDDINKIVDSFTNPVGQDWLLKERKDMLVDYFTTHVERNYNKGNMPKKFEANKTAMRGSGVFMGQPKIANQQPTLTETISNRNKSIFNTGLSDEVIDSAETFSLDT
jgi:hypothetical protein|tara:strand:+ start:780 stop:1994 length:1215 start_codon:yes stop_codon:yes gene_type:complete